ncbi:MAG: N-acetyl-D-Glu racemase DgcA [Halioglobus sp.]|mgnify:CR=1 FL=1
MRQVTLTVESWPLLEPFVITGHTWTHCDVLIVSIIENGITGRGEATGVYYLNETADSMYQQAACIEQQLQQGICREQLQSLLPAGGARNAVDCALWDLEAKSSGQSIFGLTGITSSSVNTVNTVTIDTPEQMAKKAAAITTNQIKVKLNGEQPLQRITAVCNARPDADIVVDVNEGWSFTQLVELAPQFKALGIKMIEQPLPRGEDGALETYQSPIMLCADESCLDTSELGQAARRYHVLNIKLDKTGGLTEALNLARRAKDKGMMLMVGNMTGTSLAMAPAYVIAQLCDFVDLDGALFLAADRPYPMSYKQGVVSGLMTQLWG